MQAVSKLTNQWIELFRSGKVEGKPEFTDADLDQIVANYQPGSDHEAPATIGHPTGDAPAYGWFDGLKRVGSTLLGKMSQVQPQFDELVQSGAYKKRSVGLVKRDNGWNLHHVAFLGAQAPAIKGLADCKFEQSSTPVIEVELQENFMANENQTEGFIARMDAWFKEHFPSRQTAAIETTPATFSEADVKRFAGEAVAAAVTAAVTPLQAELAAQKATFSARETALITTESTARANAAIARVKASGRWIPAFDKMGLTAVFAELAKTTETVEFGEGDAKKKLTPLDTLVSFMESLGKIVPAGADIYAGQVAKPAPGAVKFSEEGGRADRNSVDLANLSKARAAEKKISFSEAMDQVLAERPELAIPGGAAAGSV
jgi:hypothetical protein